MRIPPTAIFDRLLPLALGTLAAATGVAAIGEPLGRALWSAVAVVLVLPLALDVRQGSSGARAIRLAPYAIACAPLIGLTLIVAGVRPAIMIASVAASLAGGARLLASARVRADLAIALTIADALLAFTWPVWMADVLARRDLGPWPQRLVDVSPAFALNAAIAPDDPLTHRPRAYRLMNLGQDVSYAMPTSVWPAVTLHAGIGSLGAFAGFITRRRGCS